MSSHENNVPTDRHFILIDPEGFPYPALDHIPIVGLTHLTADRNAEPGRSLPLSSSVDDEMGCYDPMSTPLNKEVIPSLS